MKNYLIGLGAVVVAVALFFSGQMTAQKSPSLSGYVPPVQSSSGFSQSISTSTTLAATSFCNPTNIQFLGSSALVTSTLATAASSSVVCANLVNAGASVSGLFVNDSTNTVAFAAGTGDVFKCETNGVGTSTVLGGCTASAFSILASSTVGYTVFFESPSAMVILIGNNYK